MQLNSKLPLAHYFSSVLRGPSSRRVVNMRSTAKMNKVLLVIFVVCSLQQLPSYADIRYSPEQILIQKLDQFETKFMKRMEEKVDAMQQRMERKLGEQLRAMQLTQDKKWLGMDDKILTLKEVISRNSGAYFDSCRVVPSDHSNVFMLRPAALNTPPFLAYCEQNFLGGGWIVIHKRFNGELDFNRSWVEYKEGFGEPDGEHWMGLEKIHKLTRSGDHELLVILKDFDGEAKLALYDGFDVDNEGAKYKLSIGKFVHGDAGDSMGDSSGARFSSNDQDNDQNSKASCAEFFQSGWWFKNCMNANLNGLYRKQDSQNMTMNWFTFRNDLQGLKEASMLIREKVKN